jgi:mono/diheme cytochrome c family protein
MKKLLKFIMWTAIAVIVVVILAVGYVQLNWNKTFDAPYPDISASTDSALIERGRYLAFGAGHCATCHVPMDKIMEVEAGLKMPLIGGWEMTIPGLGTFRAPNITPDMETGIGRLTDAEIARTLRHAVGSDGRMIMPFMPYVEMSDYDLTALISFLRSQEPVKNKVQPTEMGPVGKALLAFGQLKPAGAQNEPLKYVEIEPTAEYGRYLAYNVANCRGCHTILDKQAGVYTGVDFAGGFSFEDEPFADGFAFVSPNLTPDPETGVMTDWSEATFLERFRKGRIHKGSPMPWGAFSRMTDTDLRAIYQYLITLKPEKHLILKTVYEPGEKVPV